MNIVFYVTSNKQKISVKPSEFEKQARELGFSKLNINNAKNAFKKGYAYELKNKSVVVAEKEDLLDNTIQKHQEELKEKRKTGAYWSVTNVKTKITVKICNLRAFMRYINIPENDISKEYYNITNNKDYKLADTFIIERQYSATDLFNLVSNKRTK